ncbi:MAG: hypothetical protein ABIH46_06860 [Chloroflexota bacterium]
MEFLSAQELLGLPDAPAEEIYLPALGGSIKIRTFSKAIKDKIRREAEEEDGSLDQTVWDKGVLLHAIVEPKLTEEQVEEFYAKMPWRNMEDILERFYILSGMTPQGMVGQQAVEEAEKNFRP